jgi:hypothetical protein
MITAIGNRQCLNFHARPRQKDDFIVNVFRMLYSCYVAAMILIMFLLVDHQKSVIKSNFDLNL